MSKSHDGLGIIWLDAAPAAVADALQDDIAGASKICRIPAQVPRCSSSHDTGADLTGHNEDTVAINVMHNPPAARLCRLPIPNAHDAAADANLPMHLFPNVLD